MGRHRPLEECKSTFWTRVATGPPEICWNWTGTRSNCGYGQYYAERKHVRAHRFAWTITYGSPENGLCVCHKCDNKLCCNPSHLFLGTLGDNNRDRDQKGRTARGCNKSTSKFTAEQIRWMRRSGLPRKELARMFKVDITSIRAILLGISYRDVKD